MIWKTTLALLALTCLSTPASAATLIVHLTGIDSHKGQIKIGLFDKADGWLDDKAAITGQNIDLTTTTGDSVDVTFNDVKPGDYAVGAYHDENMNSKLDKNFFGIPKEQWGVSNNVKPHLRAPTFDEAKLTVAEPSLSIGIELHK